MTMQPDGTAAGPPDMAARLTGLRDRLGETPTTIGRVLDEAGTGAPGVALLVIGGATFVPGVAPAFGAALGFVALGLLRGHEHLRLPPWLRRRAVRPRDLDALMRRLGPVLRWVQARLRGRAPGLTRGRWLRLAGAAALLDALLIVLPIPFGNTAPALAVLVKASGLLAGDGKAVLAGIGGSAVALGIDATLTVLAAEAIGGLTAVI